MENENLTAMYKQLDEEILKALDEVPYLEKTEDGYYQYEVIAFYDDRLDKKQVEEILSSDHPMERFSEQVGEYYWAYGCEEMEEIAESIRKKIHKIDGLKCLICENENYIIEFLEDHVELVYPYNHYLDCEYNVPIMVDTGDGNYDYTLNDVCPAYCGEPDEDIDDKASIVFLAQTQGYDKKTLQDAFQDPAFVLYSSKFLNSMYEEEANVVSHMNCLTFLTKMTLRELIDVNTAIKFRDYETYYYDATKRKDCGTITIDRKAYTGLYDPWSGGGSLFEIELEKDVELPIKYIRSALPDGSDGYGVDSVYGFIWKVWNTRLKNINVITDPNPESQETKVSA